ncbi:FAD-dependent oxidoreductase [Thermodesulfobium sp.]
MDYDVIVVGAGNAGLCAAMSAAENGAKVLLLERSPIFYRGEIAVIPEISGMLTISRINTPVAHTQQKIFTRTYSK